MTAKELIEAAIEALKNQAETSRIILRLEAALVALK